MMGAASLGASKEPISTQHVHFGYDTALFATVRTDEDVIRAGDVALAKELGISGGSSEFWYNISFPPLFFDCYLHLKILYYLPIQT